MPDLTAVRHGESQKMSTSLNRTSHSIVKCHILILLDITMQLTTVVLEFCVGCDSQHDFSTGG
jgi:hypothetical protein